MQINLRKEKCGNLSNVVNIEYNCQREKKENTVNTNNLWPIKLILTARCPGE